MSTTSVSPLSPHDEVLDQILARLDALEATSRLLAQAGRDGPALVGALMDELDYRYAEGAPMPDVDVLLERAPHLAAQAVNRRTLEALEHILSRLDALDEATRLLAQAVRDGPALVGALMDELDHRYAEGAPMPDMDALLERAHCRQRRRYRRHRRVDGPGTHPQPAGRPGRGHPSPGPSGARRARSRQRARGRGRSLRPS
ncbi:MAG: hypothetical protein Q9O62_07585 [Ardenticatenia bacterium]|nr:hypothetical protein [Ardenticatenia bacterium]